MSGIGGIYTSGAVTILVFTLTALENGFRLNAALEAARL